MSTPPPAGPNPDDLGRTSPSPSPKSSDEGNGHEPLHGLGPLDAALLALVAPGIGWVVWQGGDLGAVVLNVGLLFAAFVGAVAVALATSNAGRRRDYGPVALGLYALAGLAATAALVAVVLAVGSVAPWARTGVSWVGVVVLGLFLLLFVMGGIGMLFPDSEETGGQEAHTKQPLVRRPALALFLMLALLGSMGGWLGAEDDNTGGATPAVAEDAALTEAEKCEQLIAMDSDERIAFIQARVPRASDYEAAETAKAAVIACPAWTGARP